MVRYICHFLIVWLTLLAGGAHAVADARHEASHALDTAVAVLSHTASTALRTAETQAPTAQELEASHDKAHAESCNHSHCGHGHATGMLPAPQASLPDACRDMALTRSPQWASGEFATHIERPKWSLTTPAVVNL